MTGRMKAKGDITAALRMLPSLLRTIAIYKKLRGEEDLRQKHA